MLGEIGDFLLNIHKCFKDVSRSIAQNSGGVI